MKTEKLFKRFWIIFIIITTLLVIYKPSISKYKSTKEEQNNQHDTKKKNVKQELTYSECYSLYGGSRDMSAWELAQAECMLQQNDYKKACDCMRILSK